MRPGLQAIVTCGVLALAATVARAGEVTRLQIELPPDIRAVEPGQRVELVQVVGIDVDGRRVGFGGATPVVKASAGKVELVSAPYQFAYTAPPRIDGPLRVTLEARLPEAPAIKGSLELEVLPSGPYVLLRVDAVAEHVAWGGSLDVEVRGETRDGRVIPVADRRIEVVADGPGTLAFKRLGHYRYTAPPALGTDGRSTVAVRARVVDNAAVHGELTIALGSPFPEREPPGTDDPPRPAEKPSEEPSQGTPPAPVKTSNDAVPERDQGTSPEPVSEEAKKRPPKSVLWSGGRLRLTAWRVRGAGADATETRRVTKLPEPGGTFASREPTQRLRFVVEDATVRDVTAEARHGGADGESANDAINVKVKRNKAGKLTVVVEARPKADGTEMHVTLTLARAEGESSDDVLVLKRRKAKDAAE